MEKSINDIFNITVSLIIASIMLVLCYNFTSQARKTEIKEREIKAFYNEVSEFREWSKYEGLVTGADIVDFIMRHKDICDIVIQDGRLSANTKINTYLTGGKLIMGLSDRKSIPEKFWELTFIYDNIIGGGGDCKYTATLLYDGQLVPEYDSGVQIRGGAVTGIEYIAY